MSDRQSKKGKWFSYKSSYNLRSGPVGTLTRKSNYFEARLLFNRQWKMYVAQVQAQNKHSREAKGVRDK
jgi:HJR/Mrr/RecB family endonuclease